MNNSPKYTTFVPLTTWLIKGTTSTPLRQRNHLLQTGGGQKTRGKCHSGLLNCRQIIDSCCPDLKPQCVLPHLRGSGAKMIRLKEINRNEMHYKRQ